MLFNWMNKFLIKKSKVRGDIKRKKLHPGKIHNATSLLQFRHFNPAEHNDPDPTPYWPRPSNNIALMTQCTKPISRSRGAFHERLEQSDADDDNTNNNLTSEICKETEILNYINHLDEAGTFISESISSREETYEISNSTRDSFGSIVEETLNRRSCQCRRDDLDLIRINPEVIRQSSKDANGLNSISSAGTRDESALRKALWKGVNVIFENYGLEFLEIVSTGLMLSKGLHGRKRESKVKRLKNAQCACTSCNKKGPKFIVMVDDPPCQLVSNKGDTIARLLMIELYLLGVKMFVLPCFDFPPRILGSMLNDLKEDGRHPHSEAAYGFLLQIGFSLILQRDSADVIIFDGDWSSVDVSSLIATAERGGHELIFMKNHEGIQKEKFAQLVATRINKRMKNTSQDRSASPSTISDDLSEEQEDEDDSGSLMPIQEELESVTSGEGGGAVQSSELEDFNNNRPQSSGRHSRSRRSPYSVRNEEPCRVKSRERPRTAHHVDAKVFGKSESSDFIDDDQNFRQLRRAKSST